MSPRPSGPPPKIVITHRVHESVLLALRPHGELVPNQSFETLPQSEIRARCADAAAMIAFMPDRVDAAFISGCPNLRIVAGALKGGDNLDADACTRAGVWLTVVDDLLTVPTAEMAIGLTLGLARKIRAGDGWVRSGKFAGWRPRLYGMGLAGATIGIAGFGAVGQAIARRLQGFDCRVVYADRTPAPADIHPFARLEHLPLDMLLAQSDITILALPLTAETFHLIGRARLRRVPAGALIVNVGRGSVVDEHAIAAALWEGRIGGYAADVFACEDHAFPHRPIGVPEALIAHESTLFAAHMGSAVASVRAEIEHQAARAVIEALEGRVPEGAVNTPPMHRRRAS